MCLGGTKKEAGKKLLRLSHLPLYSEEEKERLPKVLLVRCSYVPNSWGSSYTKTCTVSNEWQFSRWGYGATTHPAKERTPLINRLLWTKLDLLCIYTAREVCKWNTDRFILKHQTKSESTDDHPALTRMSQGEALAMKNESVLPALTLREWSEMPSPQLTALLLHTSMQTPCL